MVVEADVGVTIERHPHGVSSDSRVSVEPFVLCSVHAGRLRK